MSYSKDLKRKVLEKIEEGCSVRKTAEMFNIHFTTIQNWKSGKYLELKEREYKNRKIDEEALLKDVEEHPDAYQYERAKRLNCSKSGIWSALKKLGITTKKNTCAPQSRKRKKKTIH